MSKYTYRYFRPEHGGNVEHAHEFGSDWSREHSDWIAEDAAAEHFHNHDGWEASWPMKLSIVFDDGSIETFEVDQEAEPVFHATSV